jgi:hypothetical protein
VLYGIDEPLLNKYNVRSLKYLLDDKFVIKYSYRESELGFVYVVYDKVKVYSPYGGDFKWRNSCPSFYVLGEEQLENNASVLIITKSLKDIMTFKSYMNVDVVAPQSETTGIPKEKLLLWKDKYDIIFIVYDYDETGITNANKLHEEFGFEVKYVSTKQVILNDKKVVIDKDISDYHKKHGPSKTFKHLKTMFELPDNCYKPERVKYIEKLKSNLSK